MNVWSQTLGRLVRIIQSCGANLILMKYCEKYIHIPHACAGLMFPLGGSRGVASISMSRLLRTPDVCSALSPFISRAGGGCCDGCDDGRSQPRGLTLASNHFSLIHHHCRRRRSQSFKKPLP